MENTSSEIDRQELTDWEERITSMASDPATNPAIRRVLLDALERDPVEAVRDAETVYQVLLQRAISQSSGEWNWRSQAAWCWVCNSHNTRLVGAPGYGIVHECLDCAGKLDGAIQWVA